MLLTSLFLFIEQPKTIIFIVLILVLFFGAKRIPELMRGIGQGVREFKDASLDPNKAPQTHQPYNAPQPGYNNAQQPYNAAAQPPYNAPQPGYPQQPQYPATAQQPYPQQPQYPAAPHLHDTPLPTQAPRPEDAQPLA